MIGSVANGLDLDGQQPYMKLIVEGAILLLFVTIDALARRYPSASEQKLNGGGNCHEDESRHLGDEVADGHAVRLQAATSRNMRPETTTVKVRRAVEGLGGLIDDYEFHYPQELSRRTSTRCAAALDGHGIYCIATVLHLDPRFGKGGLSSPDDAVPEQRRFRRTLEGLPTSPASWGRTSSSGPDRELRLFPFQTPYAESWARFLDGIGQAAQRCKERGVLLFLEHKNSEPAMKILMRNVGMTLHVIHTLRRQGITTSR